ncbi:Retrotransposon-derived protein PEG10 [Labeo rohita]|uniref:Retrotransposon-derived protein PEG10 n=1 Tax=Labeo rohita TaxID=84645 RepID=A0ABQ8LSV5_LABRO|nr:Retrotransposon-derived protein PEG10 [Labeo rohita]
MDPAEVSNLQAAFAYQSDILKGYQEQLGKLQAANDYLTQYIRSLPPAMPKKRCVRASTQLLQLSQGRRSAADYAIEFRTLAAQSGWNDVALKAVFQRSLNVELQAELACKGENQSFSEYMTLAIKIDNLMRSNPTKSKSSSPRVFPANQASPMSKRQATLTRMSTKNPEDHQNHQPALIDSGSALNLIHQDLIKKSNIPTQPCDPPLKVNAVNNKPIGDGIVQQTLPMQLQVGLFHHKTISFYVIDSPHHEVILGCPWLSVHDPVVSWHHGEITQWSQFCHTHCLSTTITKSCLSTSVESPASKPLNIPSCYHEYLEVFSKTKATRLPPHRPWDCAIDLLPNAMPPKCKIYPLSRSETQAMEEYIEEALSSGYIRPSTSPAAAGFFFVEKKDGGLRPCIDYRGLNDVTVTFCYPLPLVPAALEQLREATIYTKLDLRSAYNLIRN